MTEKKPFGFEVQDIRLGGVIQRLKHCKKTIEKYLAGEIDKIDELEQEILAPLGAEGGKIGYNYYGVLPTASVL